MASRPLSFRELKAIVKPLTEAWRGEGKTHREKHFHCCWTGSRLLQDLKVPKLWETTTGGAGKRAMMLANSLNFLE